MPRSAAPQKLLFGSSAAGDEPTPESADESPVKGSRKGLKSPIAWYGGKAYNAKWLIERFPDHRVYVEPFGGAANVLLRKPKSRDWKKWARYSPASMEETALITRNVTTAGIHAIVA